MPRYSVIPSRTWRSASGRCASPFGANPWWTEAQKVAEGWHMVTRGWTISDAQTNTIGLGRPPFDTLEDAQAFVDKLNAAYDAMRKAHEIAWAPINAPVTWTRQAGNDGIMRHHSGEGYTITLDNKWYIVDREGEFMVSYRSLPKAKEWAEGCIRSERKDKVFA